MKKTVPGEGPKDAKIVFIGEAPGETEIKLGRPFVGRAGKFLDKEMIRFGIDRKKVYITNLVKERVIGPPKKTQIKRWLPVLEKELEKIKPKIIVLLGRTATKNVPRSMDVIYVELPHPSAAMRFPKQKEKFRMGLKNLKKLL
ncbi:MAG: uracil-DNA glycosylase [Candidatus Aenigmatarchaeota archaeon]